MKVESNSVESNSLVKRCFPSIYKSGMAHLINSDKNMLYIENNGKIIEKFYIGGDKPIKVQIRKAR